MPTPEADIRICTKVRGKPTHRIELIRQPYSQRYLIWIDDHPSQKLPEGIPSQYANRLRVGFAAALSLTAWLGFTAAAQPSCA